MILSVLTVLVATGMISTTQAESIDTGGGILIQTASSGRTHAYTYNKQHSNYELIVRQRRNPYLGPSNCPAAKWLQNLHDKDPSSNKVFVDIGCNLGTDAVHWLDLWEVPGLTDVWRKAMLNSSTLLNAGGTFNDGWCGQNRVKDANMASRPITPVEARSARVLCVEPLPDNVRALRELHKHVFKDPSPLEILQFAVSDKEGHVDFDSGGAGQETAMISSDSSNKPHVRLPMTTVDALILNRGFPRVDVLTIDTEGNDPAVIRGAARTLNITRLLQFEVHEDFKGAAWGKTSLSKVLAEVEGHFFKCYWPGNDGHLTRLSDSSPHRRAIDNQEYGRLGWSNVLCVKRGDVWEHELELWASASTERS